MAFEFAIGHLPLPLRGISRPAVGFWRTTNYAQSRLFKRKVSIHPYNEDIDNSLLIVNRLGNHCPLPNLKACCRLCQV